MTHAAVDAGGWSVDGVAFGWGEFGSERDPLPAAARAFVGARNPRLPRLDRATWAALVATHLVLRGRPRPALLLVATEDGSALADRAFWRSARERGGADASPLLFASTLPSAAAGELAMTFELRGPCIVLAGPGSWEACPGLPVEGTGLRLEVRLRGWLGASDGEAEATLQPPLGGRFTAGVRSQRAR